MQRFHPGHKFSAKQRTTDVLTEEQVDFESLLLSPLLLKGLADSGFEKPSPIQLKAIPLGRCGLDLIAQAKSGTGKTCVFSVIALENVLIKNPSTQVLILAPTREIAVQIKDVVTAIGCHMKGLSCQVFIGGLPIDDDKKAVKGCQIAVGSPGRIKNLIENKHLKTDSIRMFILDEADKLLDESFQEQINWIFSTLPANKQMMAFSATYPEYLASHLTKYMREPTFVRLNATDPTLQGIKQFYHVVAFHQLPHKIFQEKVEHLLKLLSKVNFHQCLLFSNYQIRAQGLSTTLCAKGWPATFIAGSQTQEKRLQAMEKLKAFKCRILISTDLTARGIDAENVNLVVNMDVPRDGETYLHRIGRAGRFGTKGVAVTFVAKGKEQERFSEIEKYIGITMEALPENIPDSLMVSNSLSGGSQVQATHDTVEVSVLHKSITTSKDEDETRRQLTSGGERYDSNGRKETKDHYKQKDMELDTAQECRASFLHENVTLLPQNATINSNGNVSVSFEKNIHVPLEDSYRLSEFPEGLDDKQSIKCGSKVNNFAKKQGKTPGLPSLEEFENDFEEYLAFASTFENIGFQEKVSNSSQDNEQTKEMCNLSKKYDNRSDEIVGGEGKYTTSEARNDDDDGDDDGNGNDIIDSKIIGDDANEDGEDSSDAHDDDGNERYNRIDGKTIGDDADNDDGEDISDVDEDISDVDEDISDVDVSSSDVDEVDNGVNEDDNGDNRIDGKTIGDNANNDDGDDSSNADDSVDQANGTEQKKDVKKDENLWKDQSHSLNVIFKRSKKNKNCNNMERNSESDEQPSDDINYYDDSDDSAGTDGGGEHDSADNGDVDSDDDDDDVDNNDSDDKDVDNKDWRVDSDDVDSNDVDDVDSDDIYCADDGDIDSNDDANSNVNYADHINGDEDSCGGDKDVNSYDIKDSSHLSELQYECSANANNETVYGKNRLHVPARYYDTSQANQPNHGTKPKSTSDFSTHYHDKSTTPDYRWLSDTRCYQQNNMDHYSGLSSWHHAMQGNPNSISYQQTRAARPRTSGLFNYSTTRRGYYSPQPANQNWVDGTGGVQHQPAKNIQGYAGVYSPVNGATLVQSRETSWRSAWNNAYHNINNAVQQFATLNSCKY